MEAYAEVAETIIEVAETCTEISIPIAKSVDTFVVIDNVIYCLDASETLVYTARIGKAGAIAATTN